MNRKQITLGLLVAAFVVTPVVALTLENRNGLDNCGVSGNRNRVDYCNINGSKSGVDVCVQRDQIPVSNSVMADGVGDVHNRIRLRNRTLTFLTEHEGFKPTPYRCPAGKLTIGFGHLIQPNESYTRITQAQALELLKKDVAKREAVVDRLVTVPLTDGQRIALVSFVFNAGEHAFAKSTLLRKLNAGDYAGAAKEFPKWKYAGGKVSKGLVNRRKAEVGMFLGGGK